MLLSLDEQNSIRSKVPRVNTPFAVQERSERLAAAFLNHPGAPPVRQRVFVIVGNGGTVKSQLCAKFVHDHEHEWVQ